MTDALHREIGEYLAEVQQSFNSAESEAQAEENVEPDDGAEQSVIEIPEDSYHDELYEDQATVETIRGEDGRHIVKKGIGPFFARLFADGAKLDLSAIRTRVRVSEGGVSEKVFTDPESDNVQHTPARLKRRWPVWHRLPDLEEGEEHDLGTKAFYGVLSLVVLALPYIGWELATQSLNAGLIGAAAGALVLAVESYGAVDGKIEFEPAPRHFVSADASLTVYQNEYSDGKMLEDFEEMMWQERTKTGLEARGIEKRRDGTMTQILNESALGISADVLGDPIDLDGHELDEEERRQNGSTAKAAHTDGGEDEAK